MSPWGQLTLRAILDIVSCPLAAGYTSPSPGVLPDGTGLRGWYQGGYTGMYQWSPLAGYQLFALGAGTINTDSAVVSRMAAPYSQSSRVARRRSSGGAAVADCFSSRRCPSGRPAACMDCWT